MIEGIAKKILIVDDDKDILDIISYVMQDLGYQVLCLDTGLEVLQTIQVYNPDLVLMDVMLAGMDGRVICSNIKNSNETKNLPVILISASHDLAKSLNQHGAPNDFIAKPFDIDNLINRVKTQLTA